MHRQTYLWCFLMPEPVLDLKSVSIINFEVEKQKRKQTWLIYKVSHCHSLFGWFDLNGCMSKINLSWNLCGRFRSNCYSMLFSDRSVWTFQEAGNVSNCFSISCTTCVGGWWRVGGPTNYVVTLNSCWGWVWLWGKKWIWLRILSSCCYWLLNSSISPL